MVELGQLERHHQEFADRHVGVIVISNDDKSEAQKTQTDFPHLVVVSDAEQNMAKSIQVIHSRAGPKGDDTNAPTMFLVDGTGTVRWFRRPERFLVRLSPSEVLEALDETWGKMGNAEGRTTR
jgi:peroxiredoxin